MTIENELLEIVEKAIESSMRDIHFIVEVDGVVVLYHIGNDVPPPNRYLSLQEYKSLVAYVKKHTTFEPFNPDPKLLLPRSGILAINDEIDPLFICRVSLLPIKKKPPSLILSMVPKRKKEIDNL